MQVSCIHAVHHTCNLQSCLWQSTANFVVDRTLQIFCASLPIQCQLHNDMCDNGGIAIKYVCVLCRTLWWRESSKQLQAWHFYKQKSTSKLQRDSQRWVLAACCSPQWSLHAQASLHGVTGSNFGLLEGLEECNDIPNSYWSSAKLLYPLLPPIECN